MFFFHISSLINSKGWRMKQVFRDNTGGSSSMLVCRRALIVAIGIVLVVTVVAFPSKARQPIDCSMCHADTSLTKSGPQGRTISLYINGTVFENSVHGPLGCQACHSGITDVPHAEQLPKVDCGSCHTDVAAAYKWHGSQKEVPGQLMPDCYNCHSKHDILAPSDKNSTVNPVNLPKTCGHCHENPAIVGQYHIPMITPVKVFEESVHSRELPDSNRLAATCIDCHSVEGTAHVILPPINPTSSIYHFNIPQTCGRCHKTIMERYNAGIHGRAAAKGETDSPVCTGCHSDHEILPVNDPRSRVSPTKVSMTTCAPCHDQRILNVKYGFPENLLQSWLHSYHGLKSTDGDPNVANCSSCHRAHLVLPAGDSLSSIAPQNRQATCAKCHPSITAQLAGIPIHQTPGVFLNPTGRTIRWIYIVAIFIIIGAMFIHWQIDLHKQVRLLNRKKQIVRMRRDELWQHTLLMVTFTVLAVTGFAFHYSGSWWAKFLFGWDGGFMVRRMIHRVAAVLFMLTAVWHILYLFKKRGREFLTDIFPRVRDFKQFMETMAYDLGWRKEPPRFGRFSYIEKAEYWALVWGTVVMTFTGILLWFGGFTEKIFHIGALGILLVIHFYEAILASLAILIWHLYSTIFNPPVYPNNPSWYTGKMPEEMYRHEHPEDPIFREPET